MENQTQTLCRICFNIGHFSLIGYEINIQGKNVSIGEMIKRFSDIEFTAGPVPEMICENCTHDLVQSYLFSEKVLESDAKILNLAQLKEHENMIFEEHSEIEDQNNVVPQNKENQTIEEQIIESQDLELQNIVSQSIEVQQSMDQQLSMDHQQSIDHQQSMDHQHIETADVQNQVVFTQENELTEEIAETASFVEMYADSDRCSHDDQIIFPEEAEKLATLQIDPSEAMANMRFPSQIDLLEDIYELATGPRRKYQRRNNVDNEIDENASFVITQFASSTTAPGTLMTTNNDDTDEVAVSDVRVMNYETVEVKAGNIDLFNQPPESELPIDDSRVYLCQYCPRAFSSSAFLIVHVQKTHGCKFCGSIFEKAKELHAHIREAHSKFECVVCGKEFTSNSNMRNHLKNVHKLKVPANVSLISYKKNTQTEEEI